MFDAFEADDLQQWGYAQAILKPLASRFEHATSLPVAVVTGTTTGIGLHTAAMLAASGLFRVIATMRPSSLPTGEPRLRELVQRYTESGNTVTTTTTTRKVASADALRVCALDVTSEASWKALATQLPGPERRVDVLINNAGYGVSGSTEQVTVEQAQQLFDTNVFGVMRGVQVLAPYMRAQSKRNQAQGLYTVLIQISSLAGLRAVPFSDLYSASKFALEGLTEAMRYSLEPFGIRCICVNPGPVRSAFSTRFGIASRDRGCRQIPDEDPLVKHKLDTMHDLFVRDLAERMASAEVGQSSAQVAVSIVQAVVDGLCLSEAPSLHYGTSPVVDETIRCLRTDPAARSSEPYRRFWDAVARAQKQATDTAGMP